MAKTQELQKLPEGVIKKLTDFNPGKYQIETLH